MPTDLSQPISAAAAKTLILNGKAPAGLRVSGHLSLRGSPKLTALPADLTVTALDVSECRALTALPPGLQAQRITARGCAALTALPAGLHCYALDLSATAVQSLPADLAVSGRLDLAGCTALTTLPIGLTVGTLNLRGCTALTALPENLSASFLDLSGCTALTAWPHEATVEVGHVNLRGCTGLTTLPSWLRRVAQLNLRGCTGLTALPGDLKVSSWLDISDTAITALPPGMDDAPLRWRGVPVSARAVFAPETLSAAEVLAQPNAEVRRVLLELLGYERFLAEAAATTLDTDRDRGGERRLLRVALQDDEDLVCVAVICPSTARQYLIRVPPTMTSCRQAVAWVAGFDRAEDYAPIVES